VIKYLGSKRTLVPVLETLARASEAKSALDLFTGTTRVAQSFKQLGLFVTAVDTASYSHVFAKTWIELDGQNRAPELDRALADLNETKPEAGYFTQEFCVNARYFQPVNGEFIDAVRNRIEREYKGSWMYFPLLTSLILAADRVDSTTGIQMAFLKNWAARSFNRAQLRDPKLISGSGVAIQDDALLVAPELPSVDLAYLDPPYNQHRYFTNYHIWETLVRWDSPDSYGIARKRIDSRSDHTKSPFNSRREMPAALEKLVNDVKAETLILSYNNESWLSRDELIDICKVRGDVALIEFDFKRYIGSQIGIYNKAGKKVGSPGQKRNVELMVIAGDKGRIQKMKLASQSFSKNLVD
jgi:adenine-specific DNA-methyltransferase